MQHATDQLADIHRPPMQLLLIVDDISTQERLAELCKESFDGACVRCADQLSDAIPMISRLAPDIVFVHLSTAVKLRPTEYVSTIHSVANDEHLPVIALCDQQDRQRVETLSQCGAADSLAIADLSSAAVYRCVSNAVEKSQLRRDNETKRVIIQQNNRELAIHKQHIGSFYEAVSHELKSPLAGAREYVSLVLDGVCGEASFAQKELLTNALQCCDSLRDLIHDLLDTAAMENGMLVLRYNPCNLEQLVRDVVTRHAVVAERQGILIQTNFQRELTLVDCDELRIMQLLSHLLSNAIKHSVAPGSVQVSLSADDNAFFLLSVKDSGSGIDPAHQQRVFDKFYQVKLEHEDEYEHHEGMGVGLFLCRSIACLHGGRLSLQSTPGEGCIFTAQIPKTQQYENNHSFRA